MTDPMEPFGRTADGTPIPGRVRRSSRARRISLIVHADRVDLVVPAGAPLEGPRGALAFLAAKARWVARTFERVQRQAAQRSTTPRHVDGAPILVRGRPLRLSVREADGEAPGVVFRDGDEGPTVTVPRGLAQAQSEALVAAALDAWMADRCLAEARPMVLDHAARLGCAVADVRPSRDRSRWGSCASNGIIKLHLRLAAAPPDLLEYIVAHEVAHLRWRGHGPRFYATLARLQPDFEERRRRLRIFEREHPDLLR